MRPQTINTLLFITGLIVAPDGSTGTPSDHAHRADGDYAVILHGIARTSRSMKKMEKYLEERGYTPVNLDYASTTHGIDVLAEVFLSEAVKRCCPDPKRKIHFVTYSMGGLVLRAYLKNTRPASLGRVVMLSPPNQGSEVSDFLMKHKALNAIYKRVWGPAGQQLGTSPDGFIAELGPVDFELGVITGNRSIDPLGSAVVPGADDGRVSVERSKVQGMADHIVIPATHTFIMSNQEALRQTGIYLEHGRFAQPDVKAGESLEQKSDP